MVDSRHAGYTLRTLRKERDLSQKDVERLSGYTISDHELSRLETGAVANPSMKTLVEVGRAFGKDPNEMAALYGYWFPLPDSLDARLAFMRSLLANLSEEAQSRVLDEIERIVGKAAGLARSEMKRRRQETSAL